MVRLIVVACALGSLAGTAYADAFSDCTNKADLDLRIKGCSQVIEQSPSDKKQLYLAHNLRGSAYAQRRDFGRAIADFDKAIALEAKDAIVFAARGEAYRLKGDSGRAIADFDKAIALDARAAGAYHARGLIHLASKAHDRALADLTKAVEIEPRAVAFYDRHLVYLALGQKDKAAGDLRAALQREPGHKASQEGLKRLGATP